MDGTGFGLDGQVWGGEWLIADLAGFRRVAWLEPLPLPGRDAGIRNPGRLALAYFYSLFKKIPALPFVSSLTRAEVKTVRAQVEGKINLAMTSSAGRLFDVVAAMAGGPIRVSYEAQGAIEMEMISRQDVLEPYCYDLHTVDKPMTWGEQAGLPVSTPCYEIGLRPLIGSVADDAGEGRSLSEVGGRFHRTFAVIIADVSRKVSESTGLRKVALSGGCFQNRLLLRICVEELRKRGLIPLLHHSVPANDGGISLGQAAIGHFMLSPPL
jgi:hydrogenase maturation protein HypF